MSNLITQRLLEVYTMSARMGIRSAIAFEKRANIATSSINKWQKEGKDASIESVVKILESFPSVSAEWLMRGKGSMEITPDRTPQKSETAETTVGQDYVKRLEDENEFLRQQLSIALESLKNAHEHYNK